MNYLSFLKKISINSTKSQFSGGSVIMEAKIKSLEKALRLLECFTPAEPELGVTELSRILDMHKSTVFNIIDTLEYMGYLEKNKKTGKYRLGLKILQLSHNLYSNYDLRNILNPLLQELAQKTEETIYLGVLCDNEVIYLDSVVTASSISLRNVVGVKAPLYCTGIGKALLSALPEDEIRKRISSPMVSFTDKTIVDIDMLIKDLAVSKERGYAIDNMEHEFGVKCVSAPMFAINGQVSCAVSISGPSLRFNDETIENYGNILKEMQRKVKGYIM